MHDDRHHLEVCRPDARSYERGVEYIIRRNLWFQLINTPLVALGICLYRHFAMSDRVESNLFSFVNFIETLIVIAFCSFAIGLYWRFKFRSKYLAMELEETRLLNEELKEMQVKNLAPSLSHRRGCSVCSHDLTGVKPPSLEGEVLPSLARPTNP